MNNIFLVKDERLFVKLRKNIFARSFRIDEPLPIWSEFYRHLSNF